MACFGGRPDLAGEILLAVGDDYEQQGNLGRAVIAYREAASKGGQMAEVVVSAAGKAEKILCDNNRQREAANMYEQLLNGVKKPDVSQAFASQSLYHRLIKRLANLYRRMGMDKKAKAALARLR